METVVPVLQIDDHAAACEFYVERLGFEIEFEHRHEPGFPVFMAVRCGDLHLFLSEHGRGHPGTEVYVFVDDVTEWFDRCRTAGLAVDAPTPMPLGNTEMALSDPSRNLLRITQVGTHEGGPTPNS